MPNESPHQPASRWQFNPCCTTAYDEACAAFTMFVDPATPWLDYAAIGETLLHGSVGPALAEHILGEHDGYAHQLASFGEQVAHHAPAALGPAQLVVALAEESQGNVLLAEAALRHAVAEVPDYGPAAAELARYAIDRGDLRRAIELLRHPSLAHDHAVLHVVENLQRDVEAPFAGLGRNEMCACWSGRKYKHCCQGTDRVLPRFRAPLALHKAGFFVRREARRHYLDELGATAAASLDPRFGMDADKMARDPLILDVALFEGHGITSYLDHREILVPEEERDVLRNLGKAPRRLWQLLDVHAQTTVGLCDAATEEMVYVPARAGVERLAPESLLLARVSRLPDGDEIIGMAIEVPDEMLERTADLVTAGPSAPDLARWYGDRLALHQARSG
jgi:hypothetical protein